MKNGATISAATMITKAMVSLRLSRMRAAVGAASAMLAMSGRPSEQTGGADQQHDRHDDEDHRVGGLGEEHLGEALDDTEPEAGEDRPHDRAHAADHDDGEHHDDQVRSHLRADIVD